MNLRVAFQNIKLHKVLLCQRKNEVLFNSDHSNSNFNPFILRFIFFRNIFANVLISDQPKFSDFLGSYKLREFVLGFVRALSSFSLQLVSGSHTKYQVR